MLAKPETIELRDFFAACAMQGLVTRVISDGVELHIVRMAYAIADEMMAARGVAEATPMK